MRETAEIGRRRLLHLLFLFGGGSLAGCSSASGFFSRSSPELAGIGIVNQGTETHTVHVRLQRDGEALFEATAELDPLGEGEESQSWDAKSSWGDISEHTYSVQIDGGAWQRLAPKDALLESDIECAHLSAYIRDGGINSHYEPWPCNERSDDT